MNTSAYISCVFRDTPADAAADFDKALSSDISWGWSSTVVLVQKLVDTYASDSFTSKKFLLKIIL
jgi:hypothetical protein